MNDNQTKGGGAVAFLAAAMLPAVGALAQTVPVPQEPPRTIPGLVIAAPSPSPASTPVPVPTAPVRGLTLANGPASAAAPTRRAPLRREHEGQTNEEGATAQTPSPQVGTAPDRATVPTTIPDPVPAMAPAPASMRSPPAPVQPTPSPATVAAAPVQTAGGGTGWSWLAIGAAAIASVALIGWRVSRRRSPRRARDTTAAPAATPPSPSPSPSPPLPPPPPVPPAPPAPADGRPGIDIVFRPLRAGLNMLSAVVDADVIVTNTGDAAVAQVRLTATLLSAHAGQDADLAATYAAPPTGRPAAPPFALAPGEERRVRVVAALSREAVRSMEAAGRPMFVPLVAIDVRYVTDVDGIAGRTGQAFVVGVERVDSAKLAPFWLDGPLRMHDQIAARAQGARVVG